MKQTMRFLSIAVLVTVGAMTMSCINTVEPLQEDTILSFKTTVALDNGVETRALNSSGVKTFAPGETMAIVYTNKSGNTVKAVSAALVTGDITNEGKNATFTFELENPNKSQNITYIYPASMAKDDGTENYDALATQDGTLATLSSSLDLATYTGAWNGASLPTGTLSNQMAILAITMKNSDGSSDITNTITELTLSDGTYSYTVSRSAAAGPIYVAIHPTSTANIEVTAYAGPVSHAKSLTGKTYAASNGYSVSWRMTRTGLDLSRATSATTAQDGDLITGTLGSNVKISIAAGATVTLDNVNINGSGTWGTGNYAGLNCLGDATITIADGTTNTLKGFDGDYPGIHVPSGYTLTIEGTGTLYSSCRESYYYCAGIGGSDDIPCGNIIINDGTITATGGYHGAGIGGCGYKSCGDITINGGTVTATGGSGAAGIGAGYGYGKQCGDITINGGTVTATGGDNAAGIGTGYDSSCGNITIANTVTRVTATKGSSAANSIGKGGGGSCGTVTIGGVTGAISTSPYTYEPAPQGSISGKFSVSSTKQVYFSQGNLKYSNGTWSFHTNQYDMCFTSAGDVSANYTSSGTFDLFCYGTSGYNDKYPYMTDTNADYYGEDLTGVTGRNYDWGIHNTISNGGTGWRTPTIDEWDYLLKVRVTSSNVRYAKATVNGVAGLIILPDDWSTSYFDLSSIAENESSNFNTITFDQSVWENTFEAHGAVFLPVFSYREGTTVANIVGYMSYYWSSTYYGQVHGPGFIGANCLSLAEYEYEYDQTIYSSSYVATNFPGPLYAGHFVRLVKDAN